MTGCLWGMWHTFDDKTKDKLKQWMLHMESKSMEHEYELKDGKKVCKICGYWMHE